MDRPDTCKFRAVLSAFCAKRRRAVALFAEQFNTVEVDSTFYALPAERNAKLWAERTPIGFVFNIKPFALMTQHPAEISRLPKQLREMLPVEERNNRQLTRPSKEVVEMAFQMFWSAMGPLRESGKLGTNLLQCLPVAKLLDGSNWEYEVKYDGYRALGIKSGAT